MKTKAKRDILKNETLFLHLKGNVLFPISIYFSVLYFILKDKTLSELYDQHKDEDGFLYITFSTLPTLGWGGEDDKESKACIS